MRTTLSTEHPDHLWLLTPRKRNQLHGNLESPPRPHLLRTSRSPVPPATPPLSNLHLAPSTPPTAHSPSPHTQSTMVKVRLSRNDPVNDPWWDKQEEMTTSMTRRTRPPTAPIPDDPSRGMESTNVGATLLSLDKSHQRDSPSPLDTNSVHVDPATAPLPWDEPTYLGRALKKVAVR